MKRFQLKDEEREQLRRTVRDTFDAAEKFARDAALCIAGRHIRGAQEEIENLDHVIWTMERGLDVFGVPGPFEDMRPRYHVLVDLSKRLHADLAKIMS
ncbi:MAG: hypothetical protein J0L92_25550 [Deltaproteobacteria bacterium]|nr:hypothetical protein [Deltaproteobacteria bacterium]